MNVNKYNTLELFLFESGYVAQNLTTTKSIPNSPSQTLIAVNNWIVFLQRIDGTTNFDQPWSVYKAGFGTYNGNFWIGLESAYQLTSSGRYRIRFEVLITLTGKWLSDEYDLFYLDAESAGYAIHTSGYHGDNGDIINCSGQSNWITNGMEFTTNDQDHDNLFLLNCATSPNGGWWYNDCWCFKLTGPYPQVKAGQLQYYVYGLGNWYDLSTARMMMKMI